MYAPKTPMTVGRILCFIVCYVRILAFIYIITTLTDTDSIPVRPRFEPLYYISNYFFWLFIILCASYCWQALLLLNACNNCKEKAF